MGMGDTPTLVSPRARQGLVQLIQAELSPGSSWAAGAADRADMEALRN